ncbi:HalOD1 output domain-containing protein [Halopiger goleimassiliensis]|uniref:HalOD1 output domain-containing protein n=1 Tax=Halopiger goleimassiliensis TaxID=1293048 RepID=UPI00067822B5|nr:HalOD1 output domain-containing protein [Halopiger goleimassiliensis]
MSGTAPTDRLTPVDDDGGRTIYYHDRAGTYHVWCDEADYEPVSLALLVAVSSIRGVEPEELEPLSERIDPDALNALIDHWRADRPHSVEGSISFSFADCTVTISADGEIVIDPEPSAG